MTGASTFTVFHPEAKNFAINHGCSSPNFWMPDGFVPRGLISAKIDWVIHQCLGSAVTFLVTNEHTDIKNGIPIGKEFKINLTRRDVDLSSTRYEFSILISLVTDTGDEVVGNSRITVVITSKPSSG